MNAAGIHGYIFSLNQEYDSTLHDKITSAINDSQALVAILTKESNSRSVHEEIGYAFAKERSVVIMLEEGAKDGVLSHERDQECFTIENFTSSCEKVLHYLKTHPPQLTTSRESTEFLRMRNILDSDLVNFCSNINSGKLKNSMTGPRITAHPAILFAACPSKLLDDLPVTSSEYMEWLEKFSLINISGWQIQFIRGYPTIGLEKITCHTTPSFTKYIEILSNGFIEQGHTFPIIRSKRLGSHGEKMLLHLNWASAVFWAFLIFCKEHYQFHNYTNEVDFFLSIRDASQLVLMGFWSQGYDSTDAGWDYNPPHTTEHHIQLREKIKIAEMSEEKISALVRKFAGKIANAYGLDSDICFRQNGSFDFALSTWYNSHDQ